MKLLLALSFATAVFAALALAQVWNEDVDAGDLLIDADVTVGTGPPVDSRRDVEGIADVDMYCIRIDDPDNFSASLFGATSENTQLFLFNSVGIGIVCNDDNCGAQSLIDNTLVASQDPGNIYYIAVSAYNKDPESMLTGLHLPRHRHRAD